MRPPKVMECKKKEAPYPSYSELCHEEPIEKPSECKLCFWKPEEHPTFKPQKQSYHTGSRNAFKTQDGDGKSGAGRDETSVSELEKVTRCLFVDAS